MHFSRGTDTGAGHYQASESFDLAETDHRSRRPYVNSKETDVI
jgi:hypothetical protein